MVTNPEASGSPPKRAPPPLPFSTPPPVYAPSPVLSAASVAESFNSTEDKDQEFAQEKELFPTQEKELTVDDIEDFEDDVDLEEVDSRRLSRRHPNDAADLVLKFPAFATGMAFNMILCT